MKKRQNKIIFGAIYIAVIAIVIVLQVLSSNAGVLYSFDNTLKDSLYQKGGLVNTNIYVIGIDEETLSEYGNYDVWARDKLAELINLLSENEETAPAVIGIDIGLYSPKNEESDTALAEAIDNAGNVVLNSTISFDHVLNDQENNISINATTPVLVKEPFDILKNAALSIGHCNLQLDKDGYARHAIGTIDFNGRKINSFAYEICKAYIEEEPDAKYQNLSFYINYTGKPRDYYGSYGAGASLCKVLNGEYPASAFKDSIVLVGAYASGLPDFYFTPIDRTAQMYGVEINANVVDMMLKGIYKNELGLFVEILITLFFGLLVAILHTFLKLRYSLSINIILFGVYIGVASLAYKSGTVLPLLFPLFAMILLAAFGITLNMVSETLARRAMTMKYSKYLSPEIASSITEEKDIQLGGIQKDIAVLFVDIRGFTSLSEKMAPPDIVSALNRYFSLTSTAVFNHKGTIDKFIGDAVMAIFNAPLDQEDYEYEAVMAAIEMQETARNSKDKTFQYLLQFGIGIHSGSAIIGNIGTDFRMEYTAVGDVVNTASRIEGQAGAGEIVVSEEIYNHLRYRIDFESIGEVQLKGKTYKQTLYKVIGAKKKQKSIFG